MEIASGRDLPRIALASAVNGGSAGAPTSRWPAASKFDAWPSSSDTFLRADLSRDRLPGSPPPAWLMREIPSCSIDMIDARRRADEVGIELASTASLMARRSRPQMRQRPVATYQPPACCYVEHHLRVQLAVERGEQMAGLDQAGRNCRLHLVIGIEPMTSRLVPAMERTSKARNRWVEWSTRHAAQHSFRSAGLASGSSRLQRDRRGPGGSTQRASVLKLVQRRVGDLAFALQPGGDLAQPVVPDRARLALKSELRTIDPRHVPRVDVGEAFLLHPGADLGGRVQLVDLVSSSPQRMNCSSRVFGGGPPSRSISVGLLHEQPAAWLQPAAPCALRRRGALADGAAARAPRPDRTARPAARRAHVEGAHLEIAAGNALHQIGAKVGRQHMPTRSHLVAPGHCDTEANAGADLQAAPATLTPMRGRMKAGRLGRAAATLAAADPLRPSGRAARHSRTWPLHAHSSRRRCW